MKKSFEISVCIPVYNSEQYLEKCLESLENQTFRNFEIIVVDDCSPCNNYDKTAKRIIKSFTRKTKLCVNFVQHNVNRGLVEARRTAVYEAKGKYIFNLDSDDVLFASALEKLYETAKKTSVDIVHGGASVKFTENVRNQLLENQIDMEKWKSEREIKVNNVYLGLLKNEGAENNAILDGYLIEQNHMGFLWGKLIKRSVYIRALEHISPVFCIMGEDVLQYVWIAYEASSYYGISDKVYEYSINTGISSKTKITDINQWEKVCSTASVFTSLFSTNDDLEIKFTQKQNEYLQYLMIAYIRNNYEQWKLAVSDELKESAYELLCEYWGRDLIEKIVK